MPQVLSPGTWEAHQVIDTRDGIGRPTPEGAHRDGVDLVAVFLVGATLSKAVKPCFEADSPMACAILPLTEILVLGCWMTRA